MHACPCSRYLRQGAELILQILDQRVASLSVDQSHAADVARKMTFSNEIGQHRLMKSWRTNVQREAGGKKPLHQIFRDHHVTEPQRGEQHFAEGADVDDT